MKFLKCLNIYIKLYFKEFCLPNIIQQNNILFLEIVHNNYGYLARITWLELGHWPGL